MGRTILIACILNAWYYTDDVIDMTTKLPDLLKNNIFPSLLFLPLNKTAINFKKDNPNDKNPFQFAKFFFFLPQKWRFSSIQKISQIFKTVFRSSPFIKLVFCLISIFRPPTLSEQQYLCSVSCRINNKGTLWYIYIDLETMIWSLSIHNWWR